MKKLRVSECLVATYRTRISVIAMAPDLEPRVMAGRRTAEVMLGKISKPGPPPSRVPPEALVLDDGPLRPGALAVLDETLGDLLATESLSDSTPGAGGLVSSPKETPLRLGPVVVGLSGESTVLLRLGSVSCHQLDRLSTYRSFILCVAGGVRRPWRPTAFCAFYHRRASTC